MMVEKFQKSFLLAFSNVGIEISKALAVLTGALR